MSFSIGVDGLFKILLKEILDLSPAISG